MAKLFIFSKRFHLSNMVSNQPNYVISAEIGQNYITNNFFSPFAPQANQPAYNYYRDKDRIKDAIRANVVYDLDGKVGMDDIAQMIQQSIGVAVPESSYPKLSQLVRQVINTESLTLLRFSQTRGKSWLYPLRLVGNHNPANPAQPQEQEQQQHNAQLPDEEEDAEELVCAICLSRISSAAVPDPEQQPVAAHPEAATAYLQHIVHRTCLADWIRSSRERGREDYCPQCMTRSESFVRFATKIDQDAVENVAAENVQDVAADRECSTGATKIRRVPWPPKLA